MEEISCISVFTRVYRQSSCISLFSTENLFLYASNLMLNQDKPCLILEHRTSSTIYRTTWINSYKALCEHSTRKTNKYTKNPKSCIYLESNSSCIQINRNPKSKNSNLISVYNICVLND